MDRKLKFRWWLKDQSLLNQFVLTGGIFCALLMVSYGLSRTLAGLHLLLAVVSIALLTRLYFSAIRSAASLSALMLEDLRKLDQMKVEFLSTVSHELRTPLTSIGGYTKLLASGDAGPVTETQKEFLYIIDTNVVRLTHLINDVLDVEKLGQGKMQMVLEPQDLGAVLRECRDTFGIMAVQKGLELEFLVPERVPRVLGDYDRLVQIFMNLLSNAIKYTFQGKVTIEAEAGNTDFTVRIRDTGVGISLEEKDQLFEKFYRTRSGLSSGERGTGLGLVIVRQLVEAHKGTIVVESTPGKGTCFAVTLPMAKPVEASESIVQIEPESEDADAAVWQRLVWVIDADEQAVAMVSQLVNRSSSLFKGYRLGVRSFSRLADLPEDIAPADAPFMVIVDPSAEKDPHMVLSRLRKRLHRTTPILVISSSVDTAEIFSEGATALLIKPVEERELLIALREMVGDKGWRVLVADHSTDIRILLKRTLEQRGFIVDDVDRGGAVLSRLENTQYDLVLLDTSFGDVQAPELLRTIREGLKLETLPIFVMLNDSDSSMTSENPESWGATASIGKSRGIGGIVDAVCQYLEDRKLVEQSV